MSSANVTEHPLPRPEHGALLQHIGRDGDRKMNCFRMGNSGDCSCGLAAATIGSASPVPDAPQPLLRPFVDNLTHEAR